MCHYIAHGRVEKSSWYRPLTQPDEELDVAEYVKECRAPTQSQNVPLVEDGPTPESEGEEIIGDHNQDDILLGSEGERSTETSVDSLYSVALLKRLQPLQKVEQRERIEEEFLCSRQRSLEEFTNREEVNQLLVEEK